MPKSNLQLLINAIKEDDLKAAKENPLWSNINDVLPNDQTILQMCADAGALHCFWEAMLEGASLESEHYNENPHPLTLALQNHHNLIAQIILVLRPEGTQFNKQKIKILNQQINNGNLLAHMAFCFNMTKANPAFLESLLYAVITAEPIRISQTELVSRILGFAQRYSIPGCAFEPLAFLAITLGKTTIFRAFLEKDINLNPSFKFLDQSFLYRALKCNDLDLVQTLIRKEHDYTNVYANIYDKPKLRKLLETALEAEGKDLLQVDDMINKSPVFKPLIDNVYGIKNSENSATLNYNQLVNPPFIKLVKSRVL